MAFHDVRFPADISKGSTGGPERRTDVVEVRSGAEERNSIWADSRRKYDSGLGIRNINELYEVTEFFECRSAQLYAFRWKDWSDYKSKKPKGAIHASDQLLGLGDGTKTSFQLIKKYASGPHSWTRIITKPVEDTVLLRVGGVNKQTPADFQVNHLTGVVTLTVPPPNGVSVEAGFEFDVPVRFDTDFIPVSITAFEAGVMPNIPVIEVKS